MQMGGGMQMNHPQMRSATMVQQRHNVPQQFAPQQQQQHPQQVMGNPSKLNHP